MHTSGSPLIIRPCLSRACSALQSLPAHAPWLGSGVGIIHLFDEPSWLNLCKKIGTGPSTPYSRSYSAFVAVGCGSVTKLDTADLAADMWEKQLCFVGFRKSSTYNHLKRYVRPATDLSGLVAVGFSILSTCSARSCLANRSWLRLGNCSNSHLLCNTAKNGSGRDERTCEAAAEGDGGPGRTGFLPLVILLSRWRPRALTPRGSGIKLKRRKRGCYQNPNTTTSFPGPKM